MKQKISEASKLLGLHPANFMLYIACIEPSLRFEDIWPEIDKSWIETIRATNWDKFGLENDVIHDKTNVIIKKNTWDNLSETSIHVLDKLRKKRKWGAASVSIKAIQHLTRLSEGEVSEVIGELIRFGFIIDHHRGPNGPYSLDSGHQDDIDKICDSRSD